MAVVVKAPAPFAHLTLPKLFLAGSIDNGQAVDWQTAVTQTLTPLNIVILNPRRDDWDSTWEQSITCAPFREQVTWELDAQETCDLILIYFAPTSKAPISLLELGLFARSGKMIVCCPDGFWRKGNVEVVCGRYGLPLYHHLDEAIQHVQASLTLKQ